MWTIRHSRSTPLKTWQVSLKRTWARHRERVWFEIWGFQFRPSHWFSCGLGIEPNCTKFQVRTSNSSFQWVHSFFRIESFARTPQVRLLGRKRNPISLHNIPSDWRTRRKLDVSTEETQRSNWMDNEWHQRDKSCDCVTQNSFERWCVSEEGHTT